MEDLLTKAEFNFSISNYEEALRIYKKIQRLYPHSKSLFNDMVRICEKKLANKVNPVSVSNLIDGYDFYKFKEKGECAAIITLWKRKDYLEEQLEALKNQTKKVSSILIVKNENHFEIDDKLVDKYGLKIISSDINSLYTRWIIGYLLDEDYIYVLDDDVIPGEKWVEISINALKKYNALVGPSGRKAVLNNDPAWKSVETFDGQDQLCDWVCNSYFFKREWIKFIVSAERYRNTQKTFDDIQLATTLKIFGGINCVVPGQSKSDLSINGHIKRIYGHDENALWKRSGSEHKNLRCDFVEKLNKENYAWVGND